MTHPKNIIHIAHGAAPERIDIHTDCGSAWRAGALKSSYFSDSDDHTIYSN